MKSFHSISNLSVEDQHFFNLYGRGATVNIPHGVVHHAFEEIASKHPEVTAVRHHDETTIIYGELERQANTLANELITTHSLRKGDKVLLVYSRSIEMVVFILAVLKAGGQYIPLDGGVTPEATLSYTILNSGASLVLCLPKFRAKVEQCIPTERQGEVKLLDLDRRRLQSRGNATRPIVPVTPDDGAYIIYTSGTTGKPKGVDVSHGGITNAMLVNPSKLGITIGTNVIQQLNVGFDLGKNDITCIRHNLTADRCLGDSCNYHEWRNSPYSREWK